jgi:hypothetical protein
MFCAPCLIFGGTEGIGSRFHVLRSRTHFHRYRGHRVSFSCFALLDPCSAVPRRWVPLSYFVLPDLFSSVPRASGEVFMFCATGLVFFGTEGVGSRFDVLHSRTRFRRYRGRWVLFSYFALPDLFSAIPRTPCPVFIFCAPRPIFNGTEVAVPVFMFRAPGPVFGGTNGVGFHFHVLRSRTHFRRYRGHWVRFSCFAPGPVFGGTDGVESRFHVLRCRTHFRRYQLRRVPFLCFALSDPFLISTECVGSRFHVLLSRTHFRRYRGRLFSFSYFTLPDPYLAEPTASGLVFMFCAPGPVFGGTDGVVSRFNLLRSGSCFQ